MPKPRTDLDKIIQERSEFHARRKVGRKKVDKRKKRKPRIIDRTIFDPVYHGWAYVGLIRASMVFLPQRKSSAFHGSLRLYALVILMYVVDLDFFSSLKIKYRLDLNSEENKIVRKTILPAMKSMKLLDSTKIDNRLQYFITPEGRKVAQAAREYMQLKQKPTMTRF